MVYNNWERLVEAVLKREEFRQIALWESFSSSISTDGSSYEDESDTEDEEEISIQEVLSIPIQETLYLPIPLADRAVESAREAEYFKPENAELARQVTQLSQLLRAAARLSTSASAAVYDRPIRRVSVEVTQNLDRALKLARKCRRKKINVLHHVLSTRTAADFKKVVALLDCSLADIKWLLSIFDPESFYCSMLFSLPPIAINDPILAWIWPFIAAVHMGMAEAAYELASLAKDNDRNKMIIVEEEGIPPLLKMLRKSGNLDARSAAASALCNLANDQRCVRMILECLGVQVVVKKLREAPMAVQIMLANLVSRMSEMDAYVQEEFGRKNVVRPLVSLLGMDVDLGEFKEVNSQTATDSLHSLVLINEDMMKKDISDFGSGNSLGGSRHQTEEKKRETELVEVKLRLKVSCANALWKLAKGCTLNSKKIAETKALLVLAKIIEKEEGELKMNCLMVVMELAAVAESNAVCKRAAFKPSSTAAKVVLDQLLRVIDEDMSAPFVTPAVKAIGCLASIFPPKEKQIIQSLVTQLGHRDPNIATEAAKALGKFVCEENCNRKEHSEVIIEFDGVQKLMTSLRSNEGGLLHLHEHLLLCNLAIIAGNSKAFEQTRALSVLEGAARRAGKQYPDLRKLFAKAIHQLTICQAGVHTHRQA